MATPTIPDWPSYTDDDLVNDNGTDIDSVLLDAIGNAIQGSITGVDNPTVFASTIIDEVIEARGDFATLDDRVSEPVVGTIYDTVSASDIIDEVVLARDDNTDLNDRLDNFVADEIPDAQSAVRGLVSDEDQTFDGEKTFSVQPLALPGNATSAPGRVPVILLSDGTQYNATTGEVDTTTYTLKANTLHQNGAGVRVFVWGKTGVSGTHTMKIYWGSTVICLTNAAAVSGLWKMEAIIIREAHLKQSAWVIHGMLAGGINTTTGVTPAELSSVWDSSNAAMQLDETGSIVVKVSIQDSVGADRVIQLGCIISFFDTP